MKYNKRNKVVFVILCFFIFLSVAKAFAQEEKEVISLFEKQVDKFEKFFSSNPKVIEKQSSSDSPTGFIFFYHRFDDYKISYDVRKSDSLVSPYMGYITVSHWETYSRKCGDLETKYHGKLFTTIDFARQKRDDESCYERYRVGTTIMKRGEAKFIFAFQKKQWVYKNVVGTDNKPHVIFYNAFGNPIYGRLYVEDNDFWKNLIE